MDWIFSIRLTGDTHIAGRRSGKIQPQDIHRKAVAIFRVWIRTLRGLRYHGIGSLSEYEPILKISAICVEFSAVQSINTRLAAGVGHSGFNEVYKMSVHSEIFPIAVSGFSIYFKTKYTFSIYK